MEASSSLGPTYDPKIEGISKDVKRFDQIKTPNTRCETLQAREKSMKNTFLSLDVFFSCAGGKLKVACKAVAGQDFSCSRPNASLNSYEHGMNAYKPEAPANGEAYATKVAKGSISARASSPNDVCR